jgi:hypothetical protein
MEAHIEGPELAWGRDMPTRKQRRWAQLECYACGYEFVASVPLIAQELAWVGEDDSLHLVGQSLEPLVLGLLRHAAVEAHPPPARGGVEGGASLVAAIVAQTGR